MSFDLYDFTESLDRVGIPPTRIEHCSLAFGTSPEGWASWQGGFVCHTRSGKPWLFVFGWCDTTGWGCQDGAEVREYDHEPTRDEIAAAWDEDENYYRFRDTFQPEEFAESPADVNRFLAGELDRWGEPTNDKSPTSDPR